MQKSMATKWDSKLCADKEPWRVTLSPARESGREGVLAIARVKVRAIRWSSDVEFKQQVLLCRLQRPGADVISCAAVHVPFAPDEGDDEECASKQRTFLDEVTKRLQLMGGRMLLIGDFNLLPLEVEAHVTNAGMAVLDCQSAWETPTRHNVERSGHRHIDFACASKSLHAERRTQQPIDPNTSDHDIVIYDLSYVKAADTYRLGKPVLIDAAKTDRVTAPQFSDAFKPFRDKFNDAIRTQGFNMDVPFAMLCDCAELLLGIKPTDHRQRRAQVPKVSRNSASSARANGEESFFLRGFQ